MSHRKPTPRDFVGKTIARVNTNCINIWRFWFSDGTAIAIEVDSFGAAGPGMSLCDECVEAEAKPAPVASELCWGCPPIGYPTDCTRCEPCPRRMPAARPVRGARP